MTNGKTLAGNLNAENPHVRLADGEVATQATRGRVGLPCKSVAILAFLLVASAAADADTYQFIMSGDPVAASAIDSSVASSAATSLETATRSDRSAASPIEARYRTWDESDGIALRSDQYRATMIIFR